MAEIFGTASSAIGVIGVAGQIARGCISLRDIIKDIQDAPATMAEMAKELDMFNDVVQAIEASFANSSRSVLQMELGATGHDGSTLEQTIQHCRERMEKALKLVRRNDPTQHEKKYKRAWAQFRSAFTKSDMDKLVSSLDRSKTMLLQTYSHTIGEKQWARLEELDASMGSLLSDHQTSRSRTWRMLRETSDKLDNIHSDISGLQDMRSRDITKTDLAAGLAAVTSMLDSKIEVGNHTTLREVQSLRIELVSNNKRLEDLEKEPRSSLQLQESQVVARKARRAPRVPPRSSWNKISSKGDDYLLRIPFFGTVAVQETTVTYGRDEDDACYYRRPDKKQGVTTKISYMLPSWLSSYGLTFYKEGHVFFTGQEVRFGSPHWGLETINVRETSSDIFLACMSHDLDEVRRLFDDGYASPYDVDEDGRNCLFFLTSFPLSGYTKGGAEEFHSKLDVTSSIIDLLLDMGVDSGVGGQNSDGRVPAMEFIEHYCSSRFLGDLDEERPLALFKKLWESAKTSPLSGHDVLLEVSMFNCFCNLSFQEALAGSYSTFPKNAALWLISQEEWDIQWHPDQLAEMCSPRPAWWSKDTFEIYLTIEYWISSTYENIYDYLHTKLMVLTRFLQTDICKTSRYASVVHALQVSMEQGGFIFNAFTKKLYYENGEVAWVRHRFRKLVLLRSWLAVVFRLLLLYGRTGTRAGPGDFVQFLKFGQDQNLRVSSAFVEAYAAVFFPPSREQSNDEEAPEGRKKQSTEKKKQKFGGIRPLSKPAPSPDDDESEGWKTDDGEDSDEEDGEDTECSSDDDEDAFTEASTESMQNSILQEKEGTALYWDQPQQPRCRRAYFFFPRCACLRRASPYSACAIRIRHILKSSRRVRRDPRITRVRRRRPASPEEQETKVCVQPSDKYDFDHDWETEDEWESGYMLESAVDVIPLDTTNPQMIGKQHYIGERDFDCDFWVPMFNQVKVSRGWKKRPASEWEEAKADALKRTGLASKDIRT